MNSALAFKAKRQTSDIFQVSWLHVNCIYYDQQRNSNQNPKSFSCILQIVAKSLVKKHSFLKNKSECVQNNDSPNTDSRLRDMECKTKSP